LALPSGSGASWNSRVRALDVPQYVLCGRSALTDLLQLGAFGFCRRGCPLDWNSTGSGLSDNPPLGAGSCRGRPSGGYFSLTRTAFVASLFVVPPPAVCSSVSLWGDAFLGFYCLHRRIVGVVHRRTSVVFLSSAVNPAPWLSGILLTRLRVHRSRLSAALRRTPITRPAVRLAQMPAEPAHLWSCGVHLELDQPSGPRRGAVLANWPAALQLPRSLPGSLRPVDSGCQTDQGGPP
jgi:hypothetical protein